MDPSKKYPVIDYIYPGPQGGSVGSWSFAASRGDNQSLAELGFIVVLIEGTSNPYRSKSYHDMSYGNMAENTLPDQIAAIRQLYRKYPIDTNKAVSGAARVVGSQPHRRCSVIQIFSR